MSESTAPEKSPDGDAPAGTDGAGPVALQRLGMWIGLAKFLTGTVALGAITAYFDHQYHDLQIELEREKNQHQMALQDRQAEFTYLEHFMEHALDKDVTVRLALADYMKSVALTPSLRDIWGRYYNVLADNQKDKRTKVIELRAQEESIAKALSDIPVEQRDVRSEIVRKTVEQIQDIRLQLNDVWNELDQKEAARQGLTNFNFSELLNEADVAGQTRHYADERDLLLKAYAGSPDSIRPSILASLAFAYRALGDFHNARLSMERAVAANPPTASGLFSLAILQKNDHELNLALDTLRTAESLAEGATKLTVQLVYAGYLIHAGQRDAGLKRFTELRPRLMPPEYYLANIAWFYAVADLKDQFYEAFERALKLRPTETIRWVDEEVDIDKYREDDQFRTLCPECATKPAAHSPG